MRTDDRYNHEPELAKLKSMGRLENEGLEVIDHLPLLDCPNFRSDEDVARRCLVLAGLLQLHFGAPREHLHQWFEENALLFSLTRAERALLDRDFDALAEQQRIDIYWFIESTWALTWAGGMHPDLTLNTCVEDTLAEMLPSVEQWEPAADFVSNYRLRDRTELFEMLDYLYRGHWFAMHYRNHPGVDLDIVMERRKALEWVCDRSLSWDDVPLDT